jgi:hypothetical protein
MKGIRNTPLTDAQRRALEQTVEHGHPLPSQVTDLQGVLDAHPLGTRIQCVSELARRKLGTSLDLAVFQCAQERRRDKQCLVALDWDEETGNIHAYVKYADGELKNPQDDTVPGGDCGCGNHHVGEEAETNPSASKIFTLGAASSRNRGDGG